MKQVKLLIAVLAVCYTIPNLLAQENQTSLLSIHEDAVITSQEDTYWETAVSLKKMMEENQVKGLTFWGFRMEDGTYMFVSPTENYASLDNNLWAEVSEKAGAEKFQQMMSGFGGTYLSHKDYMAVFHPDKSYKMDDITENDRYREWHFQYVYPDKLDEYNEICDEWLSAFKEVDTPMGFGVYTNGFGMNGPVTVFMIWGENRMDVIEKNNKTTELMDGKREELWKRTKPLLYKLETKSGWLIDDLTYMPSTE